MVGSGGVWFGQSLTAVAMNVFSYLIYVVQKFYIFFCRNCDATENVISIQHEKRLFPLTLTGSYCAGYIRK